MRQARSVLPRLQEWRLQETAFAAMCFLSLGFEGLALRFEHYTESLHNTQGIHRHSSSKVKLLSQSVGTRNGGDLVETIPLLGRLLLALLGSLSMARWQRVGPYRTEA